MTALIDTNVYLSRWPFRRLPADEPEKLVATLRQRGVRQAWAGSFDAILHRDVDGVNRRLTDDCRTFGQGLLLPFGTINPTAPDWREDLRRCHETYQMPGVRLHPNYHQYSLKHAGFRTLLREAARRGLVVQIAVTLEDERTQHPLIQVPHVDVAPLAKILRDVPELRLELLGVFRSLPPRRLGDLAAAESASFEISMLEGVEGITALLEHVPLERILFGSLFPLFNLESALLKLRESELAHFQREAIMQGNAEKLLSRPVVDRGKGER